MFDDPILTLIRLEAMAHMGSFALLLGCVLLVLSVAWSARPRSGGSAAGQPPTPTPPTSRRATDRQP